MDILDLPSISDEDELDYELADTASFEVTNHGDKAAHNETETTLDQRAEENEGEDQTSSAAKKATISLSRKNRKRKLQNSDSASDDEYDSCIAGDKEEDVEEVLKLPGRLAGRVKRIINKDKLSTVTQGEELENFAAERFAQILDGKSEKHRNLRDKELEDLYVSLGADTDDQQLRFNVLFVTGAVEKMTTFDISRIFAQFNPETVRPLDRSAAAFLVTFSNPIITAEMLLEMSKPLRRVRGPKKTEEGELMESSEEEEEGQVKEEDGEDVAIVKEESPRKRKANFHRSDSTVVEVDVETVKVPPGKWRVITKHVPDNKLIYVRFATGFELRHSVYIAREQDIEEENTYKNAKIRPGLNVFDEKGNELDWDYEHDTRFFEDVSGEDKDAEAGLSTGGSSTINDAAQKEIVTEIDGVKIRTRGRGTKKFLQALKYSDDE